MAGREIGRCRPELAGVAFAQRTRQRLLQPHGGGQREGAAPGQRLFKGRDADLGLISQVLARHPPARQLLANDRGDQAALLGRELCFGGLRHPSPNGVSSGTIPHISVQNMIPQGGFRRSRAKQSRTSRSRHRLDRRKTNAASPLPPGEVTGAAGPPPPPLPPPWPRPALGHPAARAPAFLPPATVSPPTPELTFPASA